MYLPVVYFHAYMLKNKMKLLREPFAYLLNYVFVHLSGSG
jgi:hypothetical protein